MQSYLGSTSSTNKNASCALIVCGSPAPRATAVGEVLKMAMVARTRRYILNLVWSVFNKSSRDSALFAQSRAVGPMSWERSARAASYV